LHFPGWKSGDRRVGGPSPRTVRCNNFASISTPLGPAKRAARGFFNT
jgi:hypothetical protein